MQDPEKLPSESSCFSFAYATVDRRSWDLKPGLESTLASFAKFVGTGSGEDRRENNLNLSFAHLFAIEKLTALGKPIQSCSLR